MIDDSINMRAMNHADMGNFTEAIEVLDAAIKL